MIFITVMCVSVVVSAVVIGAVLIVDGLIHIIDKLHDKLPLGSSGRPRLR